MQVLGDDTLREIAREPIETVRSNAKIDWTLRKNVRANLRRLVKRVLRKHGYRWSDVPPLPAPSHDRTTHLTLLGGGFRPDGRSR